MPVSEPPADDREPLRFGQEFERLWANDRELLGAERHGEMEQLWLAGRKNRGDPESIASLEQLLAEFPNTNRAGCAAMELGQHQLYRRDLAPDAQERLAAEYFELVIRRYPKSLCEYNAPAAGRSKLALALRVYGAQNPKAARRLLEDLVQNHPGETDHLGRPLAEVAREALLRME